MSLMAAGHTNQEIAEAMGFTLDGAKWHVSEILRKLDVGSREDAIEIWRAEHGLKPRFRNASYALVLGVLRWAVIPAAAAIAVLMIISATVVLIVRSGWQGNPVPSTTDEVGHNDQRIDTGKGLIYVLDDITFEDEYTVVTYHVEGDLSGLGFLLGDPHDPSAVPALPIESGTTSGSVRIPGRPADGVLHFPSAYRRVPGDVAVELVLADATPSTVMTPHGAFSVAWLPASDPSAINVEIVGRDVLASLTPGGNQGIELVDGQGNRYPLVRGAASTSARGEFSPPSRAIVSFSGPLRQGTDRVTLRLSAYETLIIGDWTLRVQD